MPVSGTKTETASEAGAPEDRLFGQEPEVGLGAEAVVHPKLRGDSRHTRPGKRRGGDGNRGRERPKLSDTQSGRIGDGVGHHISGTSEGVEKTLPNVNRGRLRVWFAGDSIKGFPFAN